MAFITYSIFCFLPSLQYSVKLTFSSQKWVDPCPDESCHMMIHSVDSSCRSQKLGILSIMQYTDIQLEAVIKIRFCRIKVLFYQSCMQNSSSIFRVPRSLLILPNTLSFQFVSSCDYCYIRSLRVIIGPRSQVLARFQALNREICPSQGPPCPCLLLARYSSSSQDTKDVPLFLGCQSSPFLHKASLK